MKNKKREPQTKVLNEIISNKKERVNMYTKIDLKENEKMNEIIKANQIKVREFNKTRDKKIKSQKVFNFIFANLLFIALLFFIAVVEMI